MHRNIHTPYHWKAGITVRLRKTMIESSSTYRKRFAVEKQDGSPRSFSFVVLLGLGIAVMLWYDHRGRRLRHRDPLDTGE